MIQLSFADNCVCLQYQDFELFDPELQLINTNQKKKIKALLGELKKFKI